MRRTSESIFVHCKMEVDSKSPLSVLSAPIPMAMRMIRLYREYAIDTAQKVTNELQNDPSNITYPFL